GVSRLRARSRQGRRAGDCVLRDDGGGGRGRGRAGHHRGDLPGALPHRRRRSGFDALVSPGRPRGRGDRAVATTGSVAGTAPSRGDRTLGLALLEQMQLSGRFEEKAAEMYALGKIGGFLHLYIGQEAVAVGAMSTLRPDDYAIAGYREHGHILAKGGDPRRVMAELFGRRDGVSKGKGGSMHMFDRTINFLGGHAIVGGYLPIATGV